MATTTRKRRTSPAVEPVEPAAAAAPPQPLTVADLAEFMGDAADDDHQAALDWARAMVANHMGQALPAALRHNLRQALLLTAARWLLTGGENPDEPIPLQARYFLRLHAADPAV